MSLLIDRIRNNGIRPMTVWTMESLFPKSDAELAETLALIRNSTGSAGESLSDGVLLAKRQTISVETQNHAEMAIGYLDDVVIIEASNVAEYTSGLPDGTDITSVTGSLAPPFERFWIEYDNPLVKAKVSKFGILIQSEPVDRHAGSMNIAAGTEWLLSLFPIVEIGRGDVRGPLCGFYIPLDKNGRWMFDNGEVSFFSAHPRLRAPGDERPVDDLEERAMREFVDSLVPAILPALAAMSFMHCKNVTVAAHDTPEKVLKQAKRRGRSRSSRHHTLVIDPLKELLDNQGGARANGLGKALHICRGHFKTYTVESPLFGKYSGQYWWPSQVRGRKERGVIEADYRVRSNQVRALGESYREVNSEISVARTELNDSDPDSYELGLRTHNFTQNSFANSLRTQGLTPRRPLGSEPNYDLAWIDSSGVCWVVEVKSVTRDNEADQLRLGLGQVLHYRHRLRAQFAEVRCVVATSDTVVDRSWLEIMTEAGVTLLEGPAFNLGSLVVDLSDTEAKTQPVLR